MNIKEVTKLSTGKELDIEYPIFLYNRDGNLVYFETSDGYWWKRECKDGIEVYYENSKGYIVDSRKELDIDNPIFLSDRDGNKFGYDRDGREIYFENSDGFWCRREYKDGKQVYFETSEGEWWRSEYKDDNKVYFEDSDGFWWKSEYEEGNHVYYEDSNGNIRDDREAVGMTMAEVIKELGKNIRIIK